MRTLLILIVLFTISTNYAQASESNRSNAEGALEKVVTLFNAGLILLEDLKNYGEILTITGSEVRKKNSPIIMTRYDIEIPKPHKERLVWEITRVKSIKAAWFSSTQLLVVHDQFYTHDMVGKILEEYFQMKIFFEVVVIEKTSA